MKEARREKQKLFLTCLIGALFRTFKLVKGCIREVLSRSHLSIEEIIHSRPGMVFFWAPHAVFILHGSCVADEILLCKQHLVPCHRVISHIELQHVFNPANENREVLSTGYSPAPSNFLNSSCFLFSSYLFMIIPFLFLSPLHCSRVSFAAMFSSLSPVCL